MKESSTVQKKAFATNNHKRSVEQFESVSLEGYNSNITFTTLMTKLGL